MKTQTNPPFQDGLKAQGMYLPQMEHDNCGVGFVAQLKGSASHELVQQALSMLIHMEHRGAVGSDPDSGDGAGIMTQIPHNYFAAVCAEEGIHLPGEGKYGIGMGFLPLESEAERLQECKDIFQDYADRLGFKVLGYRKVPTQSTILGKGSARLEPNIQQIFVAPVDEAMDQETLERRLYLFRISVTHEICKGGPEDYQDYYFCSFSSNTIVYKGQLTTDQVGRYYLDLQDERYVSRMAIVHSRFSTNTHPQWRLAQPFRMIGHNGEINTIRGNVNWSKAKEELMASAHYTTKEIDMMKPVTVHSRSDSSNVDHMVELLLHAGRPLAHVMLMLVPEAWQEAENMDPARRDFYRYHAHLMEPWDGPASLLFSNGKQIGAVLDRNGLRPSRYCLTEDGLLVVASEAGALRLDESKIVEKGRLQPGRILLADLEDGRIIRDEELKGELVNAQPYGQWLEDNEVTLDKLPAIETPNPLLTAEQIKRKQQAFGFTQEDLKMIIQPMAKQGKEPLGSMGTDIPLAVLSDQPQHLSHYFKQLFAQVSNPPIDPIRERLVMSLHSYLGGRKNVMAETPEHAAQLHLLQPVLRNQDLQKIAAIQEGPLKSATLEALFLADGKPGRLEEALDALCREAEEAVKDGASILILSDRSMDSEWAAIPSLLAIGTVHHHLLRQKMRSQASLIADSGDIRETHHVATLVGYGAHAVCPYMAWVSIRQWAEGPTNEDSLDLADAWGQYAKAIGGGLLKIFSKMGISTLQSYHGAQIFEAVGIGEKVINRSFTETVSRVGGLDYDGISKEVLALHRLAFGDAAIRPHRLDVGGVYQWRRKGEGHLFSPEAIHMLQKSTKLGSYAMYKQYSELINSQKEQAFTLRGLLDFKKREPIPLEEVEPKEEIFKRFATGAMSFGSISWEAHTTLAIAMNRIGGRSNSGEGGEDPSRYELLPNGDSMRSRIKQVASGRFGVTSHYLSQADELQIKMAQGAKPGEGGHLPGHKVDDWIGRTRHSTPGVGLISPPPHHDIYSIEDLAQLIYDLKNGNSNARVNVKLVAETGVGTIASGVSKGKADAILIAGHDGGTGASPLSSIRHAGLPWELGLSEAHQTLVLNDLRSRVVLQTDGQIKTGRDLAIAALLGAEEWGVSTAALVSVGCIMMRKCHLNTCPVGVATQNKELRKLFTGEPEHVINLFTFMAEELREIMAELGFRSITEMVGQSQWLKMRDQLPNWKAKTLDLSAVLYRVPQEEGVGLFNQQAQDHGLGHVLDRRLVDTATSALEGGSPVESSFSIVNTDRSVGGILSHEVSRRHGANGLPEGSVRYTFHGSAGQSFGVWLAKGLEFYLEGEANDYTGKGLSGGKIVVKPAEEAKFAPSKQIIIGNVTLMGATKGQLFVRGRAGERFCVRNSGATAVVEGVGDHACEYMTGGTVVVLGETGRNFAAGMSGGQAYVYDPEQKFAQNMSDSCDVDLDTLDAADHKDLEALLKAHHHETQSDVAARLLFTWESSRNHFIKVMPREYKAVLARRAAEAQQTNEAQEAQAVA